MKHIDDGDGGENEWDSLKAPANRFAKSSSESFFASFALLHELSGFDQRP